ncbi:transmembrane sensor [Brevundimonas sp. UYEF29]|uniref:FecR family protein n=1 Tax=Brevundimonas sp. UYEF29 TaxID=3156346 RepID=UPI003397E744
MTIEGDVDTRRKEAADWFARLNQRTVTTADVRGFSDWRRDPENARAFSRVEAMWEAAGTLAKNPDMANLTRDAAAAAKSARKPKLATGRLIPIGVVGALTLALGAGGVLWMSQQPTRYATAVGEQRTIQLEDGSRITLDTGSEVAVRFTGGRRSVTLNNGQAMFDVEGDPARPFIVAAGDTRVTAIGTRFDVRRSGTGARVILVEGRVDVRREAAADGRWALSPGQEVTTSAPRPTIATANVPASTSWTSGRLTFENTPIAEAVAEVNRYSREPIELRDSRISSVQVSGVFNAGDIDGFVAALSDLYALQSTKAEDGRIVLSGPA